MNKLLNELLYSSILTEDEIKFIEIESKKTNTSIEECIIKSGLVNKGTIERIINQNNDIFDFAFDLSLLKKIPYCFCLSKKCIPIFKKDECLHIVMVKNDINIIQEISKYISFGCYKILKCSNEDIITLIEKNYISISNWTDCIEYFDTNSIEFFINRLLIDGFTKNASDIHISCYQNIVRVKYRIDGKLKKIFSFHKDYYGRILVKLKFMFLVDITSCFKTRDGKMKKIIFGNTVNFRISFHNCVDGENVVIRIIKSIEETNINQLGYNKNCLENINKMINSSNGVVFFIGPTGSGKTTSMYVVLNEIDKRFNQTKNIMTAEDPIECRLSCLQQTDINQHPEMNFQNIVRSILRQDVDVLMIGEVRDRETVEIVFNASMTGHLVITTFHAYDVLSLIDRLCEMGLNKNMCIDYICGVVSQRLVKKVCTQCGDNGCQVCEKIDSMGVSLLSETLFFDEKVKLCLKSDISRDEKLSLLRSLNFNSIIS